MRDFKVCYVSAEVSPFANPGSLAYTSKTLPVALKSINQDIRLMMPKYKLINERKYVLREVIRLREVGISLNGSDKLANGKTAFLPNSKVHVYFLSVPEYFDRKGVYADEKTGKFFPDNAERFAYFCKGVLETLKLLYWQPDIIHCSDWTSALIPFYLKTHYKDDEFFQNTRTVLTLHNLEDQGLFPLDEVKNIGIPEEILSKDKVFGNNGKVSLLRGGIHYADVLNTVGESRAKALLSGEESAHGLEELLQSRKKDFVGITNGGDYIEWDPENDKFINTPYNAKSLQLKEENRTALLEELDLDEELKLPLVSIFTDFSDERGGELLLDAMEDLLKIKAHFILMGKGDDKQQKQISGIVKKFEDKISWIEDHDKKLAHKIIAGSDIMLVPTPMGEIESYHLNGMRYGTVPVVPDFGAYSDTVEDFSEESGKGNAFAISKYNKTTLLKTLRSAVRCYDDKKQFAKVQKNGMRANHSWSSAADKYIKLYEKASKKK